MLIVLDALGVIFRTHDDRSGHLTRFVADKGVIHTEAEQQAFIDRYFACTRGELRTAELWQSCGLDPLGLDEEYVEEFVTTTGLVEFVEGNAIPPPQDRLPHQ